MRVLNFVPIAFILFATLKADPPTYISCKHAASMFDGAVPYFSSFSCPKEEPLGTGSEGVVYLLSYFGKKSVVKVSEVDVADINNQSDTEEKVYLDVADVKKIVHIYGRKTEWTIHPRTGNNVKLSYVWMEYAPHGTLTSFYAKNKEKFDDPRFVLRIALDIAEALKGLHEKNWVHADLKTDNVVITDGYVAKLIDFDLATPIDKPADIRGTPYYYDYRIVQETLTKFDQFVDTNSVGVIIYYLWNGGVPFPANTIAELKTKINDGQVNFKREPERTLAEIVIGCMNQQMENRLSVNGLIKKIQDYLQSETDVYLNKLNFMTTETPDFQAVEVLKTVSRKSKGDKSELGTWYRRRILSQIQIKEDTVDYLAMAAPLAWVIAAALAFLVFRAIANWFDRSRQQPIDIKAEILPQAGLSVGEPSAIKDAGIEIR